MRRCMFGLKDAYVIRLLCIPRFYTSSEEHFVQISQCAGQHDLSCTRYYCKMWTFSAGICLMLVNKTTQLCITLHFWVFCIVQACTACMDCVNVCLLFNLLLLCTTSKTEGNWKLFWQKRTKGCRQLVENCLRNVLSYQSSWPDSTSQLGMQYIGQ